MRKRDIVKAIKDFLVYDGARKIKVVKNIDGREDVYLVEFVGADKVEYSAIATVDLAQMVASTLVIGRRDAGESTVEDYIVEMRRMEEEWEKGKIIDEMDTQKNEYEIASNVGTEFDTVMYY